MKNNLSTYLLLCMIWIATSCAPSSSGGEQNIAIVEQYVAAVENQNVDEMERLLGDDYIGFGPSLGDTIRREAALENWKDYTETLYESISYDNVRLLPVVITDGARPGEYVSMYSIVNITFKSGEEVKTWANTVYKIEAGRIAQTYTFYNEADVYEQLGYSFY